MRHAAAGLSQERCRVTPGHENRHLERQRHPRAASSTAGWIARRAARRRLSAGDQGVADQVPAALCEMEGYWCYWHGGKGLLGRRPAREQGDRTRAARRSPIRRSTTRTGSSPCDLPDVTVASVYVPNGGKDFDAKMRFLDALEAVRARRCSDRVASGGDLRRPEHRAHRHGRASEGAQAAHHRPASRGARAARAHHRPRPRRHRPRARAGQRSDVHVVGAVAEHAPAQHRLAPRLPAGQHAPSSTRCSRCVVQRDFGTSDHAPVVAEYDLAVAAGTRGQADSARAASTGGCLKAVCSRAMGSDLAPGKAPAVELPR